MPISVAQFLDRLRESELVSPEVLDAIAARLPKNKRYQDAEPLLRELVEAKTLTQYQAGLLVEDRARSLVLGDYVILNEIGAGGMGQVFQARHRRLKRIVALKVLSAAFTRNEEAIKRFQREMEAAARLTHPNIVAAFDAREQNGVHYLVMEYVAGEDLREIVKKQGSLAPDTAVDYIMQVAVGLAHAHREGVVHRDIKPANLLVDTSGRVKILDMGIARFDDQFVSGGPDALTKTGSLMGTAAYMAPEQALDVRKADGRADIYSLGCTLFHLLTGREMFPANTYMEQVIAHREEPIPPLTSPRAAVSKELDAVFRRMVAKRASERYQSMDEVHAALVELRGRQPLPSPMPPVKTGSSAKLEVPPSVPTPKSDTPKAPLPAAAAAAGTYAPHTPASPPTPQPAPRADTVGPVIPGTAVFNKASPTSYEPDYTTWVEDPTASASVSAKEVKSTGGTHAGLQTLSDATPANKAASHRSDSVPAGAAQSAPFSRGKKGSGSKAFAVIFCLVTTSAIALVALVFWGDRLLELWSSFEQANRPEKVRPEPEVEPQAKLPEVEPKPEPPTKVPTKPPEEVPPEVKPPPGPSAEDLAGKARMEAEAGRKAWQAVAESLPELFHPPAATEAESRWLAAETAFQTAEFAAANKLFPESASLYAKAREEGLKTMQLRSATLAELTKLDDKRKQWQKTSQGIAAKKLPASAESGEQAYRQAQETARQLESLPLSAGLIAEATKWFDEAISSVQRERQTELADARSRAQKAIAEAEQLFSASNETVKGVYARFPLATQWRDKAAGTVKEGDALAAGDHLASLKRYSEGEAAARSLVSWLNLAPEPITEVGRLRKLVATRTAALPDPKLDLYASSAARLDAALALVLEADPRPALAAARQVETQIAQVDEVVKQRPLLPRKEIGGAFGNVAVRRSAADESLRAGKLPDAEKLYREAHALYPRLSAPFDARAAQSAQSEWAAMLGLKEFESNPLGMKLALIPPGDFDRGTTPEELKKLAESNPELKVEAFQNELPRHRVRISRPFQLAIHETTQADFQAVLDRNPSWGNSARLKVKDTGRHSVENVSWFDAAEFCNALSKKQGLPEFYELERGNDATITGARAIDLAGSGYRLPTEAEWEYAARAGTTAFYHFGGTLTGRAANIDGDFPVGTTALGPNLQRTAEVGSYLANSFGLFDMHGNVWEWCEDGYEPYRAASAANPLVDPLGGGGSKWRVLRGGSWVNYARNARSAVRMVSPPDAHDLHLGFRIARTP